VRRLGRSIAPWRVIALGAAATLAVSSVHLQVIQRSSLYLGERSRSRRAVQRQIAEGTSVTGEHCSWFHGRGPEYSLALERCTVTAKGRASDRDYRRFFILGDSHAANFTGWISDVARQGFVSARILYVSSQIVPLIRRSFEPVERSDMAVQNEIVRKTLSALRRGDVLILANYLPYYLIRGRDGTTGLRRECPTTSDSCTAAWVKELRMLAARVDRAGAALIVVLPLPDFRPADHGMSWNLVKETCTPQWFRPSIDQDCVMVRPRAEISSDIRPIVDQLKNLAHQYDRVFLYDPLPVVCPASFDICSNYRDKEKIYVDTNHLNYSGAKLISDDFSRFLRGLGLVRSGS
jgi:hypothetical protein